MKGMRVLMTVMIVTVVLAVLGGCEETTLHQWEHASRITSDISYRILAGNKAVTKIPLISLFIMLYNDHYT